MPRQNVNVELTWSEAMNLIVAGTQLDTAGWTRAAKAQLRSALEKLAAAVPMDDPNAVFLVVRGQTVAGRCAFTEATERAERRCTRDDGHEGGHHFGNWVGR